jgi:hypothetical protein
MLTLLQQKYQQEEEITREVYLSCILVAFTKLYLYGVFAAAHLLFIIHTYLILANKTTFECNIGVKLDYLRDTQPSDCVFSQGMCSNIWQTIHLDDAVLFRRTNKDYSWTPMLWQRQERIIRDSDDVWNHPWQNKYWHCC